MERESNRASIDLAVFGGSLLARVTVDCFLHDSMYCALVMGTYHNIIHIHSPHNSTLFNTNFNVLQPSNTHITLHW